MLARHILLVVGFAVFLGAMGQILEARPDEEFFWSLVLAPGGALVFLVALVRRPGR